MGIRTRRAHMHSRTHVVGFGIAGVFGFIALLITALALSLGTVVSSWLEDLPDYTSTDSYLVAEPTRVFDADGNELASYYLQQRRSVDLSQISDYVIKGTVDTEDRRFYQHNGIDPQGILRAIGSQLMGRSEGASTITQQLVRNTILSDEQFEYSLKRKVREAYIAIQMEKMYTKDQILNMYLNTIYYGNGAYGIEAASIIYFNKHASDLTLAEAATLIGLPNSPTYYDPTSYPERSVSRRNVVLERMCSAGTITQEECDAAKAEELVLNPGELSETVGTYPYFTDYVRSLLLKDFSSETVLQGGLKVYTTISAKYQDAAEQAVSRRLEELGNEKLASTLVSIDPSTGYIKAMVGGQDYSESQYNLALTTNRQMGSSFKAIVLAAAIDSGMNPEILLDCSSPMQITPTWKVKNYGNYQYGVRSLASATAISSNTGYAQVAEAIGVEKIISMAHALGVTSDIPQYYSIALGSVGVSALDMCDVFATFAAGGVHRDAVAITKIEDRNGNTVYEHKDNPTQAISTAVAQATTEVLETVFTTGTARTANSLLTINQPVAGKTGTSDDDKDLWLCGYTPQLATVVWCGYRDSQETVIVNGSVASTNIAPQYIWAYYMNQVLEGVDRGEFITTKDTVNYKSNSSWTFVGTSSSLNSGYSYSYSYSSSNDDETTTTTSTTTTTTTTRQDTSTPTTPTSTSGSGSGSNGGGDDGTGSSDAASGGGTAGRNESTNNTGGGTTTPSTH